MCWWFSWNVQMRTEERQPLAEHSFVSKSKIFVKYQGWLAYSLAIDENWQHRPSRAHLESDWSSDDSSPMREYHATRRFQYALVYDQENKQMRTRFERFILPHLFKIVCKCSFPSVDNPSFFISWILSGIFRAKIIEFHSRENLSEMVRHWLSSSIDKLFRIFTVIRLKLTI